MGFLACSDGEAERPGLVVIQEFRGLTDYFCEPGRKGVSRYF